MPQISTRGNKKNLIINGGMQIAQRGASFAAIANSTYMLDRYSYSKSGAMVHTVTQDTDVPTVAQAGQLFTNSMRFNLTTPDTAIAAGDVCLFQQRIEGYNFSAIAQKQFTLSFWVKATLAGVYCVAFQNSARDRSYISEYTINNSATWEYKTVTVLASPSAGTWDYNSGIGLEVRWVLACGTSAQSTAGSWLSANVVATANQVNGVNTGATDFRITGIVVNEGTGSVPFKLFSEGSFADEVLACQRYYEKSYPIDVAPGTGSTAGATQTSSNVNVSTAARNDVMTRLQVQKRTLPATSVYDLNGANNRITRLTGTGSTDNITPSTGVSSSGSGAFFLRHDDSTNSRNGFAYHWTSDAEL